MQPFRQGDVLLYPTREQKPTVAKKVPSDKGRVVLAYGEVTGHAHALTDKTCTLYAWEGNRLLEVKQPTDLNHEEHSTITVAPGNYKIIQQKEYSPEAIRNVAD